MTPEQVLAQHAHILSQNQRESYFENGYLLVENAVPRECTYPDQAVLKVLIPPLVRSMMAPETALIRRSNEKEHSNG